MFFFDNKKKFEGMQFPEYVQVGSDKYFIDVVFSSKRSSSVVIRDNRLVFRMSSYLSKKTAEEHFAELLKKIYKKVEKSPRLSKTIKDVLDEMKLCFADTIYEIEYSMKVRSVKFMNGIFYVNPKTKPENIEKYFVHHLIEIYTPRIKSYVTAVNMRTYNFGFSNVELKLVNSKWGHCTATNSLMFNLKLLNAPIEVFDYVIVHELAHIRHKNHSAAYWREVSRFCPNYKRIRKMLKDNPPMLFK